MGSFAEHMRGRKAASMAGGDTSHDVLINAVLKALDTLMASEDAEDEDDDDSKPLRAAKLLVQDFADEEHRETYEGVTKQAQLYALAKMRLFLADKKSVGLQHRDDGGRFRVHEGVRSHDPLVEHLTGPNHGMAILPEWRGSTRNMTLAHEATHANRPQSHDVADVSA